MIGRALLPYRNLAERPYTRSRGQGGLFIRTKFPYAKRPESDTIWAPGAHQCNTGDIFSPRPIHEVIKPAERSQRYDITVLANGS